MRTVYVNLSRNEILLSNLVKGNQPINNIPTKYFNDCNINDCEIQSLDTITMYDKLKNNLHLSDTEEVHFEVNINKSILENMLHAGFKFIQDNFNMKRFSIYVDQRNGNLKTNIYTKDGVHDDFNITKFHMSIFQGDLSYIDNSHGIENAVELALHDIEAWVIADANFERQPQASPYNPQPYLIIE